MHILDKHGNTQTLAWLIDEFGPLELDLGTAPDETPPAFDVAVLQEVDDLDRSRAPAPPRPMAAASIGVEVLDETGQPLPGQTVVFWWPDAPSLPGAGYHDAGVLGTTDDRGRVSFAVGRGAYYDPARTKGPHDVWIYGPGVSWRVSGLGIPEYPSGMIAGTNHRHLDVTFQRRALDAPEPPRAPYLIADAIELLRQALDLLTAKDEPWPPF